MSKHDIEKPEIFVKDDLFWWSQNGWLCGEKSI